MIDNTNNKIKFSRDDRLTILAQVCLDNNVTPQKGNFAGLIRKVCLFHLHISENAAKELTRTLATIYRSDQWSSLLHPELDEVPGESGLEANRINIEMPEHPSKKLEPSSITVATDTTQDREALHAEMTKLAQNTHPEQIGRAHV